MTGSNPPAHITPPPDSETEPPKVAGWADRFAFNVWVVLFLIVICAGLANYLGIFLKPSLPG